MNTTATATATAKVEVLRLRKAQIMGDMEARRDDMVCEGYEAGHTFGVMACDDLDMAVLLEDLREVASRLREAEAAASC